MGARDLLADLVGAGLHVATDGDRLLIRPASKLTDGTARVKVVAASVMQLPAVYVER